MNTHTFLPVIVAVAFVSNVSATTLLDFGSNKLDFGNSTFSSTGMANGNTASDGGQFRWANIISVDGRTLDLIAEVSGGQYKFANANNNGLNGEFGQINVNHSTNVEFTFTIVDTGTNNAVAASAWDFALFDLDTGNKGSNIESLSLVNNGAFQSYTVTNDSELLIGGTYSEPNFTATTQGYGSDNPSDPATLTALQENRAVLFSLTDTASFTMVYNTTSGRSGRNFLFAGEAEFNGSTITLPIPPTPPVAVPEPSSSMLLLGAGLGFIIRRKRKQEA
ncbi:PEP-CTERM sorting domain-containing protein [Rubritalea spongiae]|uniref:PEP-CTERM sorting domain-containing protein n=1 Tax=Rubritalea spongiae TaxID=430797 RepID=A0ABW5DXH7_9BACT